MSDRHFHSLAHYVCSVSNAHKQHPCVAISKLPVVSLKALLSRHSQHLVNRKAGQILCSVRHQFAINQKPSSILFTAGWSYSICGRIWCVFNLHSEVLNQTCTQHPGKLYCQFSDRTKVEMNGAWLSFSKCFPIQTRNNLLIAAHDHWLLDWPALLSTAKHTSARRTGNQLSYELKSLANQLELLA